jgi:hypothetical protein
MLNVSKSEYGQFPAPQVMMRQIQHKDPALAMSTYQKGAQAKSLPNSNTPPTASPW